MSSGVFAGWRIALEAVMAREKRTWHGVLSASEIAMRRKQIACIAAVAAKAELRRQKRMRFENGDFEIVDRIHFEAFVFCKEII